MNAQDARRAATLLKATARSGFLCIGSRCWRNCWHRVLAQGCIFDVATRRTGQIIFVRDAKSVLFRMRARTVRHDAWRLGMRSGCSVAGAGNGARCARAARIQNGHETLSASPRTESGAVDSRFVHSSRFCAVLIRQIRDASSKGQFRHPSEKCALTGGVHTSRFFAGSRRKRARVARIRPQPPVSCRLRAEGRCFVAGSDAQRFRFGIW